MAFASVNIHHAKTHLSSLPEMVERGDEVVIARAGKPIARLVKFAATRPKRKLGQWEGQITLLTGCSSAQVGEKPAIG